MRLSIIDKLMGREPDDYDDPDEEFEVAPQPVRRTRPPSLDPPILQSASRPSRPTEAAPLPTPPVLTAPQDTPSAVHSISHWSGRDAVSLLNDLTAGTRERVAEALALWHDTETQLAKSLEQTRSISEQTDRLLHTTLADPEFAGDAVLLRQSSEGIDRAVNALNERNRARVRDWVITSVYANRAWPPAKVAQLFASVGCGTLTLSDLQPRLRSMDAGQRMWAAEALGELGAEQGGAALLGLLRDPDPGVRATAVSSIGRHGEPAALQHLSGVIKRDPDWSVRLKAIEAAQTVEGYESIGFLHELLKDRAWWRELQLLQNVETKQADGQASAAPEQYERIRGGVVDTLLSKIQAVLPSADPAHRAWLLDVLGDTGDPRAVPILSSALHDTELDVRLRAIRGLGRIGGSAIVELIVPALKDQQAQVRIQAAQALGDANDFRAVEPLLEAMRDADQNVRGAVAVAVSKIVDTRALKPLLAALNDPDKDTRDQTQNAMRRMSDPATLGVVMGLLDGSTPRRP